MKKGFTLIELVIVLFIISILLSYAYPSYTSYLLRARRLDGQTALLDLAARLEHFYGENESYLTATIGTGQATDIKSNHTSAQGWYTLAIQNQTASAYTLIAIPQKAQTQDPCQTLVLDHHGNKSTNTQQLAINKCW